LASGAGAGLAALALEAGAGLAALGPETGALGLAPESAAGLVLGALAVRLGPLRFRLPLNLGLDVLGGGVLHGAFFGVPLPPVGFKAAACCRAAQAPKTSLMLDNILC